MPRHTTRTDYRHFPASYTQLLERFEDWLRTPDAPAVALGPLPRKAMLGARADLYRFRMMLIHGAETGDTYARDLLTIANQMTLSLEPAAVADGPADTILVLRRNPVDQAIAMLEQKDAMA